ncbi:sensor histidine kinase [Paenibacillus sp. J22TS3]|uniref:sensor histidine kinase n=1 Tax=Paenibacillus sp. J22TS3 TaxID=2807192 RepID=UPI001B25488E|nr:histidine kinase [Paenibacillus sp. J22TS3]GIP24541.1 two-component sensor histidine kinase [Paenibacillus sp. J22TS3]
MELWTVGNKLCVLFFVVYISYFGTAHASLWLVFYFVLYISMNLLLHTLKDPRVKQGLLMCIIAGVLAMSASVDIYVLLLLPFSLYELATFHVRRDLLVLPVALLPAVFLRDFTMIGLYLFVTLLSCCNFVIVRHYMKQVIQLEEQAEVQRSDRQRLSRMLSENQELIRTSEYMNKLEERNRLSQTIHDGIGHAMTGALIQMEAAKRLLMSHPDKAEELLQNAIGISKEGIEEIRLTLKNIKPPIEQLGFSRLKAAVESFGSRTGLQTTLVHEGDMGVITPLQWQIIQANVIEALTNTAKYAQATAVHVEIRVLNRLVKAVVSDNGQGNPKIVKGLGLIGMEERTAAVQGTVIADGTGGFRVTTLIPHGTV